MMASDSSVFNYSAPGEIFITYKRRLPLTYRRFSTAAEALQFAIEEFSQPLLESVVMEVDAQQFDHRAIRELYEADEYPLIRRGLGS